MFIFFIITLINHARKILTIKTEVVKIISFNLDVAKYFPNIDITNPWIIYNSNDILPKNNKYLLVKSIFLTIRTKKIVKITLSRLAASA